MLNVFRSIAFEEGITPEEVYQEIQQSIDDAWRNPRYRIRIMLLTRSLRKPNPDSLILSVTNRLKKK